MMKTTKRFISYRFNRTDEVEEKLGQYAEKGLFLEKMGSFFWTFKKDTPKKVHYNLVFFEEASMYNPTTPDKQLNFYDLAESSGWKLVNEQHKMLIFRNDEEDPIPMETDPRLKFQSIKNAMKKSYLFSLALLICMCILNLFTQYRSYTISPRYFLSTNSVISTTLLYFSLMVYCIYSLGDYFWWCKETEKQISNGGDIPKCSNFQKWIDRIFLSYFSLVLIYQLLQTSIEITAVGFLFLLTFPLFIGGIHVTIIKGLQKLKVTARNNLILSALILFILTFCYMGFINWAVLKFDLFSKNTVEEIVSVNVNGEVWDYEICHDDIPITVEMLFGEQDFPHYSYEKIQKDSLFLTYTIYYQSAYPMENPPPELEYYVMEPKWDFAYKAILAENLEYSIYSTRRYVEIDPTPFNADIAYQLYDGATSFGKYLLTYGNKIIVFNSTEPLSTENIQLLQETFSR